MDAPDVEVAKIQRILEIARSEINKLKADRAIELVRTIELEEGRLGFERLHAEKFSYSLRPTPRRAIRLLTRFSTKP
jgi:hypothetical protein